MNDGTKAELAIIGERHERGRREREASSSRLAGHEEHVDRGILLSMVNQLVRELVYAQEAADKGVDVWRSMYRALKDGSEASQNLAHAKDMKAQRDEARAALKKLRDALLGVPGEGARHSPGFGVAVYTKDDNGGFVDMYDVSDGYAETVCACTSRDVADALAEICNEATK